MDDESKVLVILSPIIILCAIVFAIVNMALKSGDDTDPDKNKTKKHIFGSLSLVLFVIVLSYMLMKLNN